ncbi:hypothetical protein JHD48_08375 [Sulfurimonas sp. SAG-AH-194-I05]|nr:hypothetical protein [Sulfurimonas sp. SAG-AH-194-I05]MDF1875749.1 hypothetical protein [Sulfurimonas sp. SAG-AH-194-I05]
MKKNIIFLSKPKLVGVDSILPVLYDLKKNIIDLNIIIIYYDKDNKKLIENNTMIYSIIKDLNIKTFTFRNKSILSLCAELFMFFRLIVFKKNILFKVSDCLPKHKLFIKFMNKVSTVYEVLFNSRFFSIDFLRLTENKGIIGKKNINLSHTYININYDYFVSNFSFTNIQTIYELDKERYVIIDYPKVLQSWVSKIEEYSSFKYNGEYMVYYLNFLGKKRPTLDRIGYDVLVLESIECLKKIEDRIHIVFKPHPTTDIEQLKSIITQVGLKNYSIEFEHHMVLAKDSSFVLLNHFSTLTADINFQGIATILYDEEDIRIVNDENYNKSMNSVFDFNIKRNKNELISTFETLLLDNKTKIKPYLKVKYGLNHLIEKINKL